MEKNVVVYSFDCNNKTLEKNNYVVVEEANDIDFEDVKQYTVKDENGKKSIYWSTIFDKMTIVDNKWQVCCLDDGTNSRENEKNAKSLFLNFINTKQKTLEMNYREKTKENNLVKETIQSYFENPKMDFIEDIKKQAINCQRILCLCNNIDCLFRLKSDLSIFGCETQIMVEIDNHGLIPLNQYLENIDLGRVAFYYDIRKVQLENYKNLGTVLYDFDEKKMYFSVYKEDEEYAIIEDTTLETLEEDYQNYLDRENYER